VSITGSVVVAELIGKMQGSYKLTFKLSLYLPNITYREPRELSGVTEASDSECTRGQPYYY